MIEFLQIKKAIGRVLERNKYKVFASDVQEGFEKPACFVELSDFGTTTENDYITQNNVNFDILYVPQIQTHEHIIITAELLKNLFVDTHLAVGNRQLAINSVSGEIENGNLRVSLEVNYLQENPNAEYDEQYEKIQELEVNYGTTTSNN